MDGSPTTTCAELTAELRGRIVMLRPIVADPLGDTVHVALRGRVFRFGVVAARQEAETQAAEGVETFVGSPMTGVVRQVVAAPGAAHAAGDALIVVEAMKMEFAVLAPRAVVVDEVRAAAGDRVEIGQVLVTFKDAPR